MKCKQGAKGNEIQSLWVLSWSLIKIFKKMLVCLSGNTGCGPLLGLSFKVDWWQLHQGPSMAEGRSSLMELNFRSYGSYRLIGKDPEAGKD